MVTVLLKHFHIAPQCLSVSITFPLQWCGSFARVCLLFMQEILISLLLLNISVSIFFPLDLTLTLLLLINSICLPKESYLKGFLGGIVLKFLIPRKINVVVNIKSRTSPPRLIQRRTAMANTRGSLAKLILAPF